MSYQTKSNPAKKEIVEGLEKKLDSVEGIVFTDFSGLSVAEMNKLRSSFFEAGEVEYIVAKNTLMKIALKNHGHEGLDDVLKGNTAMAIGYNDPVKPVKVIADFAKETKGKPAFKGGIIDGEFVTVDDIEKLKEIPPMEVLMGMIVGGISNPLSGFVMVLNETVRSFVGVIDAIIEQKKANGEE